jgi:beta-galactosidase
MQFPYGAVYFRKSNPPKKDWERDYQKAAEDGMNIFRHWFMWGAIETAPGVYDWEDYDAQLDLAAKYGIQTIIAEITSCLPEWIYQKYPELLNQGPDRTAPLSEMGVSCAVGGFHNELCLNHPKARDLVRTFLNELARRYKSHKALLGYDIWNECNYRHHVDYNDTAVQAYREWLKNKYGGLRELGQAWYRYSYTDWSQVNPPHKLELYPECFDWLEFRKINAYNHMRFKTECIREIDPDCLISAHGTAQSLDNMALGGSDDWMAAEAVELYGYTFVPTRKGSAPYKAFCAADLTRAGAKGKTFWHAEAQGGPLWLQPQLTGRPLSDGRITKAEDIRLWNMISMAGGARGILFPRWRPLLDGPLFGAFGPYGMDGKETPRSRMASQMAKWSNNPAQKSLMDSAPVKGDVGIVVLPESQTASKLLSAFGAEDHYFPIIHGAYQGFFDNQIQADWVRINDIDEYGKLYLPYPLMMTDAQTERIAEWVKTGGILVSEGCPGYLGGRGKAREIQPGGILARVFGVNEADVMFIPDILDNRRVDISGSQILTGEYLQTYTLTESREVGAVDGACLAAINIWGAGKTMLIGTSPSLAYHLTKDAANKSYFKWLSEFYNFKPEVSITNSALTARLSSNGGERYRYLWIINPSECPQTAEVRVETGIDDFRALWLGGEAKILDSHAVSVRINAKDAIVASLR